jgi:galactose-1-phosphate uridylyltransferase
MIDFIYKANEVLSNWTVHDKWTVHKLAEATNTSLPHILQYLNEGLGKEVEITGTVTCSELSEAMALLRRRYKDQIEERERKKSASRRKAVRAFDLVMNKTRSIQAEKKWHHAYKTLCYFAGQYEEELPKEYATTLCSDLIRMGIKGGVNIQEISRWLQKGVGIAMSHQNREGISEALDFMDAYGEYFLNEDSGKGPLLLGSILAAIEEPAARYELWEEYKTLVNNLYPINEKKES